MDARAGVDPVGIACGGRAVFTRRAVMLRNLALAAIAVLCVAAAIVAYVRRTEPDAPQVPLTDTAIPQGALPLAPRATPQQVSAASQALMPEGFEALSLGMDLPTLERLRPHAHRATGADEPRADGREVWEEDDSSGARLIYLIDPTAHTLAQVQFASTLHAVDEMGPHFLAMQHRYGTPTGVWDCPGGDGRAALRRFTWRHDLASVMEATLITAQGIGLTLVVATNDDIARALSRSSCRPVRSREALTNFPVATDLPSTQTPVLREIFRDP